MSGRWYEELYERFDDYDDEPYTQNTLSEIDFLEDVLGGRRDERVLDVGCGTGRHSLELAGRGYEVVGVDLSPDMIHQAVAKATAEGLSPEFSVGDARELAFDSEFDVALILCEGGFSLVETDEMDRLIVAGASRALRDRGLLMLTAPNADHMLADDPKDGSFDRETLRETFELTKVDPDGAARVLTCNQRYYRKAEIRALFEEAGLGNVEFFRVTTSGFARGEPTAYDFELGAVARKI